MRSGPCADKTGAPTDKPREVTAVVGGALKARTADRDTTTLDLTTP